MKRVLVTGMVVLFFLMIWQSVSIHLPFWLNLFFPPPLILVFSLQVFRPFETATICLVGGFIVDVLGGMILGTNMIIMLLMAFGLSFFNIFSGRIHWQEQAYYVIGISFIYRIVALLVQLIFFGSKANAYILQIFIGPLVDGLISIIFYRILLAMLSWVNAIDQSDMSRSRIGLR